ncbi:hypothetical protein KPL74_07995 [Bacillus sp. NP157]|nr:hypothetical protein KPL74_07995 [Bacillus sp. NP157]
MNARARPTGRWAVLIAGSLIAAASAACLLIARVPLAPATHDAPGDGPYLWSSDTFGSVYHRLGQRVDKDPAALHAVRHAAAACTGNVWLDWMRRRSFSPSEKAFRRWQASYCNSRPQDGWARMYETGEWIDLKVRHPRWSVVVGAGNVPPDFYDALPRDAPPPDIRLAQMVLANDLKHRAPWSFGRDLAVGPARHARLGDYQRAALQLLECDLVGGCGINGVLAFETCRREHACRMGISMADILWRRYTPDEMAVIEALHQRLLAQRADYANSHAGRRRDIPRPSRRMVAAANAKRETYQAWEARWNAAHVGRISKRRAHASTPGSGT